jgi:diguanylate cyclase (GGDEF)-like protein
MQYKLIPISLFIFLSAAVSLVVTVRSWNRRTAKGGFYFSLAMLALTFWTLVSGLDYAAVPLTLKVFFAKLEVLGYMTGLGLFTAFALSYAGFEDWLKKPWVNLLLVGLPAVSILLAFTNDLHQSVWVDFPPSPVLENVVIFVHGPGFGWILFSGYLLALIVFCAFVYAALRGPERARKQARLLVLAQLVLVGGNLLYLIDAFNIPGLDWSSIAFTITGVLFLYALYNTRFLDVIPVARNTMIERMIDAVLVLDSLGNLVDANPQARTILGLRSGDLWTPYQSALKNWPEIIALLDEPNRPEATELTLEKQARSFDLRLTPLTDNLERSYGLLVVMREITERKRTESVTRLRLRLWEFAALLPVEQLMQKALDEIGVLTGSPIAFYHAVDPDEETLTLQAWSTRTRDEFCKAEGEGRHYPISQAGVWVDCVREKRPVIHNDYASLPHRKSLPEGHTPVVRELAVPTLREGRVVSILGVGNKTTDYDQRDVDAVEYFADLLWTVVDKKRAEERIQQLNDRLELQVLTDDLTGLANRRAFFQRGEEEVRRVERYQTPLSVIVLDGDRFKTINDSYGHSAGDGVLQTIADVLRRTVRDIDLAARFGGDEFGILLPNTDVVGAVRLAERLRMAIKTSAYRQDGQDIHVTVSIGVAEYGKSGTDLDTILRKADAAQYQAKEQGRDRVIFTD